MSENSDLPNLGLLIKLLKMTTASNDSEALSAMRKANEQLVKFGGDWESLLKGKVTVIGDPFADVSAPPVRERVNTAPPAPKARMKTQPKPFAQATGQASSTWGAPKSSGSAGPARRSFHQSAAATPKQAPAGPIVFTKYSDGRWVIKSPHALNEGRKCTIQKRNGSDATEEVGSFITQDYDGYFLYRIGKASKHKSRYADTLDIQDLL